MVSGNGLLMPVSAVEKVLGISSDDVQTLVSSGNLLSVIVGPNKYISKPSLAALLGVPVESLNIPEKNSGYPSAEGWRLRRPVLQPHPPHRNAHPAGSRHPQRSRHRRTEGCCGIYPGDWTGCNPKERTEADVGVLYPSASDSGNHRLR